MMAKKKRFIDNDEVKEQLAALHRLQLQVLMERLETGLVEVQELRLIWDMVKAHGIGMESVEDVVKKALSNAEAKVEDLDLSNEWSFE